MVTIRPIRRLRRKRRKSQKKRRFCMSTDTQQITKQQQLINQMNKMNNTQPPLVYAALGLVTGGFWALGTSVQVLTSEAWMMHETMNKISFNAYGQLVDACHGA